MKHIELEYGDLKRIVTESVNTILKDFSKNRTNANFDNPLSRAIQHPLTEGLIKTYPLNKTIKYIKDYFKLSDNEIYPIQGYGEKEQIGIKVPIIGNNLELVKKAFNLCGWYLGYPKEKNLKQNTIYELQFEKKYDDNFSELLRQHESVIYHVTPIYNTEKIKNIGFTPRSKNNLFEYPSRTYFIIGSAKSVIPYIASELSDSSETK